MAKLQRLQIRGAGDQKAIDYIFVSKSAGVSVKKYAVLSDSKDLRYPSDHLPVLVELELR
ncbi:MAG: hypothetical protein IPH31_23740 [Lewinellaceae bacterium]|nr:hypothetical protein [Lewinellaceae bacterium]